MIRFITKGKSHGKGVFAIVRGVPKNLNIKEEDINIELKRRQAGYGRGERMEIEKDKVEILSGIRSNKTTGGPITLAIWNKDWKRDKLKPINVPRPGHADLPGAIKYAQKNIRNIWERASARETVARVAAGAVAKRLLKEFNIEILSHVLEIGGVKTGAKNWTVDAKLKSKIKKIDNSPLRCLDKKAEGKMIKIIDRAKRKGDSVGGVFEIIVFNVPVGLGSYSQWNKRLNAKLSSAVMSVPGIKGVEIGLGFKVAEKFGSKVHDEIFYKKGIGFFRKTNNAGGIEGGISNGEPIILRAAMKPIPTLSNPLRSIDIITKKSMRAPVLRADTCAVPAAGVVAEAMVAIETASALLEKFGSDTLKETKTNYKRYIKYVKNF